MESMLVNYNANHLNLSAINVMEILVLKEVDRQLEQLTPNLAQYIKRVEVATYALNRLPSFYAASQEGLNYQLKQAKQKHRSQIVIAVRQGIAAVQRDPLRRSTPLAFKKKLKFNKNKPSSPVKSIMPTAKEMAHQAAQELRESYSQDQHANFCRMAMELAD